MTVCGCSHEWIEHFEAAGCLMCSCRLFSIRHRPDPSSLSSLIGCIAAERARTADEWKEETFRSETM